MMTSPESPPAWPHATDKLSAQLTSMLVSKVGCGVNVWDARESKLEEECLLYHWRRANQTTEFEQQKSGADNDEATKFERRWVRQY
jgi:hypothetical protein